ncbi:GEVED domain-containing protein [uncultured Flavobacterium sp.]|uniref:beta strand repeat-containing protein n=1 Tax=uncultured Flavobacterium sp. TaxID=165435 RepID=UPI0025D66212|nr:GEVED domain-containing protein [uncultured Flavobacterium sp.]
MRNQLRLHLLKVLTVALMLTGMSSWGQDVLYSTNFGSGGSLPTGWTSSSTSNGWNVNSSTASTGYTGASGNNNVRFAGTGPNFVVHTLTYSGLSTAGYTNITVLWGGYGTSTFPSDVIFQWSTNGTVWNDVAYTYSKNGATWALVNGGVRIALPAAAAGATNLRLRFSAASRNNGNYRIDDFSVQGTEAPTGPSVTTNAATNITASSATLNGSAVANTTGNIALSFNYGTTTTYGTNATGVSPATATGTGSTTFSGTASGLSPNTTYNFRANAGTANGTNATFVTLANVPAAPLVDGATASSLNVTIDAVTQNSNPATTQYAIRDANGLYVDGNGNLGSTQVWLTAAQWGAKTINNLSASTTYSFQVKARNSANNETAFSSLAAGTTLANTAPTLSASTLAAFGSACINTTAGPNDFDLLGENLTSAVVTVGPREGFTFATTSGGEYTNTLTFTPDAGNVLETVYVKFTPTAAQPYTTPIPVTGGGASDITVAVSGTGINTQATVTTSTPDAVTAATATLGGNVTSAGTCSAVTERGVVYATSSTNLVIGTAGVIKLPAETAGTGVFTVGATGLAESTTYYVRAYATNAGGTSYGSALSFTTQCATPVNVTSLTPVSGNAQVALSWANGSCSDGVIVVAKAASAVTAVPSGSAAAYTANSVFGTSGTAIAANEFVVFNGTGTSVTVTGLTNGTTYHFKVFTRKGNVWSSGVATSSVPALVYCTPTYTEGGCSFGDRVDGFVLNGISNTDSACNINPDSYINYPTTTFTTTLFRGVTYEAQVTNGAYQGNIAVWIDFNNDGTFSTSERFRNTALVAAEDVITFSIPVPANATIGEHRVRVMSAVDVNNSGNSILLTLTPCGSYEYGETEDYTITINDNIFPTVTTAAVTDPASTTAIAGGNVTSDNGSAVTARGVVYGVNQSPALGGTGVSVANSGTGTGVFTVNLSGLMDNTTYYIRAFATNANGTSYGNQQTFTTTKLTAPVATEGTFLATEGTGFVANWNAVTGATNYKLDVSTSSTFGTETAATFTEGFENMTSQPSGYLPTGDYTFNGYTWTFNNSIRGNNSGVFSLQFSSGNGAYAILPAFNKVSGITFRAKANSGGNGTTIIVRKIVNGVTTDLAEIDMDNTYENYTVPVNETSEGVRIVLYKNGNLTNIDNLTVQYMSGTPSYVSGYQNRLVGNTTSYNVTGTGITAGTTNLLLQG